MLRGDAEAVGLLLAVGAFVDQGCPDESKTPFLSAVLYRHTDIVRSLLAAGADVRAATSEGHTALHLLLRASSVKPMFGSGGNKGVLLKACSDGDWRERGRAVLELLCGAEGLQVNALCAQGFSPLHMAADSGDAHAIRALVAAGADPKNQGGFSKPMLPAQFAASGGHQEALLLLLSLTAT